MANYLAQLTAIGQRFAGIDVAFRRDAPAEWTQAATSSMAGLPINFQAHWRIRVVVSKNERSEYRATTYGETFDEAAEAMLRL